MNANRISVTAIIPCAGRIARLKKTLNSIDSQSVVPAQLIIVDGSPDFAIKHSLTDVNLQNLNVTVVEAAARGAGVQREQGLSMAEQPFILFMDDDIDLEDGCIEAMWDRLQAAEDLGGCNALIMNQSYHPPGKLMRRMLGLVGCPSEGSLAGTCCGPALNFLPANNSQERTPLAVEWLNTTCTLYRRAALPSPIVFLTFFHGYSLMEDAALSMQVARTSKLETLPTARIFHDSVHASYKSNHFQRACMECSNRWFVMTRIMGKTGFVWNLRLAIYEVFVLVISLRSVQGISAFPSRMAGMVLAFSRILTAGRRWRGYP